MLRRPKATKPAFARGREFKLRLPPDVSARIEAKAEAEGRPQNRIIINELAEYPDLKSVGTLAEHLGHFDNMLLKYSARIEWLELVEDYNRIIDEVLATKGAAHEVALDKLRSARKVMQKHKADSK
jgi:hypothetical protein